MTKKQAKGNGRVRPSYLWVPLADGDRERLAAYAVELERTGSYGFKVNQNRAASILMHEALERFRV